MKKFTKIVFITCFCLVSARVSAQWSLTGNDGVNAAANFLGTLNSADLVFKTNNIERMRVNTSGNIGIGTTKPFVNLHIKSSDPGIRMESSGYIQTRAWDIKRGIGQYANLYFIEKFTGGILTDPADVPDTCLTLTNKGRVGIKTSTPLEALDVNGRIKGGFLTTGSWPKSPDNYIFWGTNALDQTVNTNYALLQGTVGPDQGRTFVNSPVDIRFRIKNSDKMVLAANGNIGIGTVDPQEKLDVNGRIKSTSLTTGTWPVSPSNYIFWGTNTLDQTVNTNYALLQGTVGPDQGRTFVNSPVDIRFRIKNSDKMVLAANGNVGIGTASPQSTLAVNGKITAKEVEVTLNGWADFVFKPDYKLRSLEEVEQFIKANCHLPDVPSEKDMLSKNHNLGQTDALLMQKIEELTLYIIELKKELNELKQSK